MHMIKQTLDFGTPDTSLLLRTEGGYVDLGTYEEVVFDHESNSRKLSVTFEYQLCGTEALDYIGKWFEFLNPSYLRLSVEWGTGSAIFAPPISSIALEIDSDLICRFEAEIGGTCETDREDFKSPSYRCTYFTSEERYWEYFYEELRKSRGFVQGNFIDTWQQTRTYRPPSKRAARDFINLKRNQANTANFRFDKTEYFLIADAFSAFDPPAWDDFRDFYPLPEPFYQSDERRVLDPTNALFAASSMLAAQLSFNFWPIGPLRATPKRFYLPSGQPRRNVGMSGEHTIDLLVQYCEHLLPQVNDWFRRLGIDYELIIDEMQARYSPVYEVRFRDTRRPKAKDVSFADIGYGVSQLLPIIVACLSTRAKLVTIEQPELHVHPALQAEIGSLLAEAIRIVDADQVQEEIQNHKRFLIETHSEHLILRLQRLVRSGVLKPDDVAVLYVSRGKEGSDVTQLRLDENGDFLDDWPGGFFPERLRELGDD
ncbi:MAG: DUF3696 domain-containing protein [Candidatus Hydrogenedentes bacterium]|nr:DUF3696 domain-containing protein [Candidatus Hydrogenedentota bacterium]